MGAIRMAALCMMFLFVGGDGHGEEAVNKGQTIRLRAEKLPEEQRKIAEAIAVLVEQGGKYPDGGLDAGVAELGYREGMSLADVVRRRGKLYQTLSALFGAEWAELMRKYWEREMDFPFPIQCSKDWVIERVTLSVRSREPYRHFANCVETLARLAGEALERDAAAFVDHMKENYARQGSRLGLILDEYDEDKALFEKIKSDILAKGPDVREAGYCGGLFAALLASRREDAAAFLNEKILLNFNEPPRLASRPVAKYKPSRWVPDALLRELVPRIPLGTLASQIRMSQVMGMGIWEDWERREICEWFGLDGTLIHPENWGRIDEVIHSELTDRDPNKRTIVGPVNEFCTYIALWAESQHAVEDAAALARRIVAETGKTGKPEKSADERKANALWFARLLDRAHWRLKIAAPVFADARLRGDSSLMSLAVLCALHDFTGVKIVETPVANVRDDDIAHLTREEREDIFLDLLAAANEMIAGSGTERVGSFGWLNDIRRRVGYTVNDVARLMTLLVARKPQRDQGGHADGIEINRSTGRIEAWDFTLPRQYAFFGIRVTNTIGGQGFENIVSDGDGVNDDTGPGADALRDRLCELLPHLDAKTRQFVLRYVVWDGLGSPAQRRALVEAYAASADSAWAYGRSTAFEADDYARLETFLADTADTADKGRPFIMLKLMQQEPEALGGTIARLLDSSNPRLYRAGFDLLALLSRRAAEPGYAGVYERCRARAEAGPNAAAYAEYAQAIRYAFMDDLGLCDPAAPAGTFTAPPEIEEEMRGNRHLPSWLEEARKDTENDDARFTRLVRLVCAYLFAPWSDAYGNSYLGADELARAWRLGILPEKDFVRLLVAVGKNGNLFYFYTEPELRLRNLPFDPELRKIVDAVIDRVVYIENHRGDFETPATRIAENIAGFTPRRN